VQTLIREAQGMMLESLFGLSLVLNVSLGTAAPPAAPAAWLPMSVRQKEAALRPLVHRATECVVRRVSADPRYRADIRADAFNDLIIDSLEACKRPVQAMIDAHDRMYGSGSGEAFLLGPYFDVLPAAVSKQVKLKTPAP
jgi:hypothetical protein